MGLKCKFSKVNGKISVIDENGDVPEVFSAALEKGFSPDEALNLWATTYTENYQSITGVNKSNSTLESVEQFIENSGFSVFSKAETSSVKNFMRVNGFSSSADLYDKMNSIFRPNGYFDFDIQRMVSSGIYSLTEAQELDPAQIINTLSKLQTQLFEENLYQSLSTSKNIYKNTNFKTVFGTYETIDESQIYTDILDNLSDISNLDEAVSGLPYQDFVDKYQTSSSFRTTVQNRFKDLKKIPKFSIVNNQLSFQSTTYTTVKNTIRTDISNLDLDADVEYLNSIDSELWKLSGEEIKPVVKELENKLAFSNIDVIGLSEIYANRAQVMDLINTAHTLTKQINPQTIKNFVEAKNAVFTETENSNKFQAVDPVYKDLNIVSLQSNLSSEDLFKNFGLIKVGENLYHKVQRSDKDALYDYLYEKVVNHELFLPPEFITETNLTNKTGVLGDISKYVMSKETGYTDRLQEEIALNQLAFGHLPLVQTQNIADVLDVNYNPDYLKGDFISDFYNYYLQEKQKNSEIFRKILSNFEFNDRDISLKNSIDSVDDLEYSEELKDYFRLKKDELSKNLYNSSEYSATDDLFYLNNPSSIKQNEQEVYLQSGEYLVTKPSSSIYTKVGGEFYRKAVSNDAADLYLKVNVNSDSVYNDSSNNFDFDVQTVNNILEQIQPAEELKELSDGQQRSEYVLDFKLNPVNLYSSEELKQIENKTQKC